MTDTLIIAQVRNANHDDEKFILKAMDYNEKAIAEENRLAKEIKKANRTFWQTLSDGDECYLASDYTKKPCKVVYAIVHNELSNYGSGFGIYGLAYSEDEAAEKYRKHIKWENDHWNFGREPESKKLDAENNNGILFKDIADSDQCSMEFACIRLISNGNEVEVNF